MPRDQDLGAVFGTPDERNQKMLTMPHRKDDRQIARDPLVDFRRLDHETVGVPDQAKIFSSRNSQHFLDWARAGKTLDQRH